ncbi:MAG: hypothetical protein WBO35_03440, partial [Candidatus Saccharimonadales bacterium]
MAMSDETGQRLEDISHPARQNAGVRPFRRASAGLGESSHLPHPWAAVGRPPSLRNPTDFVAQGGHGEQRPSDQN